MKTLTEKKKVYLLLLETILSFATIVLVCFLVNKVKTDFLATNVPYQVVSFGLILFIYLVVATLNKQFKLASIFNILSCGINLCLNLGTKYFPQILFINPSIISILRCVCAIFGIAFAYFFCKGFYNLVSQKTDNIVLANKWKKLLPFNVIVAALNFITVIINILAIENLEFLLLFSLVGTVLSIYVGVCKLIYTIKTAKELP